MTPTKKELINKAVADWKKANADWKKARDKANTDWRNARAMEDDEDDKK